MTVPTSTTVNRYTASATQTVFPYTFLILDESELSVTSNGGALTLTTDYTVSGVGNTSGGNITLTWEDGAVGGEKITILRNVPYTQLTDYVENDPFPAQTHEDALDRLTMQIHQVLEEVDRAPKFDVDSTQVDVELEEPVAGELLRWKTGGGIDSVSTSSLSDVSATGVDVTDTDATKDKLVSNALAKDWEDVSQVIVPNNVASSVNYITASNAIAAASPNLLATGSDANIDIELEAKGTGDVIVKNSDLTLNSGNANLTSGNIVVTAGNVTITGGLDITGDADVDNININGNTIISTDANGNIVLTPNGTGSIVLDGQNWPQADGTANYLLKTNGSGQLSYFRGGWHHLATGTATSPDTELDFTSISSAYPHLAVVITAFVIGADDREIAMRLDIGSGFAATGYVGEMHAYNSAGTIDAWSNTTYLPVAGSDAAGYGLGTGAGEGWKGGIVYLWNANDASGHTHISGETVVDNSGRIRCNPFGGYESNGAVTGIRLFDPTGGTVTATAELYGIL